MRLRQYQTRTADETEKQLARGHNVLIQAPCGSGKTEIAIELVQRIRRRWLIVVHTNVLAEQTERRFREAGVDVERYGASDGPPEADVVITSIQMALIRDENRKLAPDLICYDEAHHYQAVTWSDLAERYPNAQRVGLTATPERQDGKSLLRHFDRIVVAAPYRDLITQGVLVRSHVWASATTYPEGLAADPIEAWNEYSEGAKTIVAFGKIHEARLWAERFNSVLSRYGRRAACVDGDTKWQYNQATLREFSEGTIDVLTNVYYIAEGFDLPDVGCIVLARRFGFRGSYMQFVGRALRSAPDKSHATIIDLTGATHRHGRPDNDRPWTVSDHEPPHVPLRGYGGEREGVPRRDLHVSGEGLVCMTPIRARNGDAPTIPSPKPLVRGLRVKGYHGDAALVDLAKRERRIAAKKTVEIAREWAARERRRHVSLVD